MPDRSSDLLVFAHRGGSERHPEHTLAAYEQAIAGGVDGIECDVRLSRDGHLVCVHDRRLHRTSDGRGLVRRRTLAELQELDFGSWHSNPAKVLPLEDLLALVRDTARPLRVLIETKHPSAGSRQVEPLLHQTLRRFGLDRADGPDRTGVTVMSFSPLALARIRALAPELPRVFLMEFMPPGLPSRRLPFGAGIAGPGVALLRWRPGLVRRLRARGYPVYVWTVNSARDLEYVRRLGVTGVITDRPGFIRARLNAAVAEPPADTADSHHGRPR